MTDPFRHVGDYGQPRTRNHRGLWLIPLALAIGAAMLLTVGGIAKASTVSHPHPSARVQLHRLEQAIVSGATFSLDHLTYIAHPVRAPRRNHADTRLCDALRAANDAGLPSDRQLQAIARDGLSASQPWRDAAGQLIMAIYAGGPFGAQYTHLAEICNPGWAS